jgi:hypothetical protein
MATADEERNQPHLTGNSEPATSRDWRAICQEAAVEQDSERLLSLVSELLERLEDSQRFARRGEASRSNSNTD